MPRGSRRIIRVPVEPTPDRAGSRYALVVGIDTYAPHHADLANARNDAVALRQRLADDFGYAVTPLLDREATRREDERREPELHETAGVLEAAHVAGAALRPRGALGRACARE